MATNVKEYLKEGVEYYETATCIIKNSDKQYLIEILAEFDDSVFQDQIGQFITDAINEKLQREREGG